MDPTTTTTTVSNVLSVVGEVFEASIGWVGTVSQTIAGDPLLLIGVAIPIVGLGVGLFKRLLHV